MSIDCWLLDGAGCPSTGVDLNLLSQLNGGDLSALHGLLSILVAHTPGFDQLMVGNLTVVVDQRINGLLIIDVDVRSGESNNSAYS